MHNFVNTGSEGSSPRVIGERSRTLFSRDLNYLRDMALFWPFVLYSIRCLRLQQWSSFPVRRRYSPAGVTGVDRC